MSSRCSFLPASLAAQPLKSDKPASDDGDEGLNKRKQRLDKRRAAKFRASDTSKAKGNGKAVDGSKKSTSVPSNKPSRRKKRIEAATLGSRNAEVDSIFDFFSREKFEEAEGEGKETNASEGGGGEITAASQVGTNRVRAAVRIDKNAQTSVPAFVRLLDGVAETGELDVSEIGYAIVTGLGVLQKSVGAMVKGGVSSPKISLDVELAGENYKEKSLLELVGRLNVMLDERWEKMTASYPVADSVKILRALLRSKLPELAEKVYSLELKEMDVSDPRYASSVVQALSSLAAFYYDSDDFSRATSTVAALNEAGPKVRALVEGATFDLDAVDIDWTKLVLAASKCESRRRKLVKKTRDNGGDVEELLEGLGGPNNVVYSVLGAMTTFPSNNSDTVYEAVANALVRRVHFVTGAVGMNGLPKGDRGEVAFIGRSNVGKSSLVNMVTARKALAYTSKRPGKTQQFNYFAVNDKVDVEREIRYGDEIAGEKDFDSFYICDLPGFGFAKVPEKQRREWRSFMREYFEGRRNLRVVFHLVDSRHGLVDEDTRIMEECASIFGGSARKSVNYVVVLTKADKNTKGGEGRAGGGIIGKVREVMREKGVGGESSGTSAASRKLVLLL